MDTRKIYSYYKLEPIDILDSIDWAREHFDFYDGVTSPLWNKHVQREFARLNKIRSEVEIEPEIDDLVRENN